METTGETPVSKSKREIIKEAKRLEESTLYSSKGHFVAATFWSYFHSCIGLLVVVGTTTAAALVLAYPGSYQTLATILYVVTAILAAVLTFLNPNDNASAHQISGNHYDALCARTRIFWSVECWQDTSELILSQKILDLSGEKNRLNLSSPQIPPPAYWIARRQIAAGQASYAVDKDV